jgi:hypothetical protein
VVTVADPGAPLRESIEVRTLVCFPAPGCLAPKLRATAARGIAAVGWDFHSAQDRDRSGIGDKGNVNVPAAAFPGARQRPKRVVDVEAVRRIFLDAAEQFVDLDLGQFLEAVSHRMRGCDRPEVVGEADLLTSSIRWSRKNKTVYFSSASRKCATVSGVSFWRRSIPVTSAPISAVAG